MVFAARVRWYRYIWIGGLGGLGSGFLAALLELSVFPVADQSLELALVLSATILSSFAVAGVALGAGVAIIRLCAALLQRLSRSADHAFPVGGVVALGAIAPLSLLLAQLARGRQAGQLLGPFWVRIGLALGGAAVAGAAAWGAVVLARRVVAARARYLPLSVGAGLLGLSILLFYADARLYHRLYDYLHLLVMAGYLVTGLLASLAILHGLRSRSSSEDAQRARRLASPGSRPAVVLVLLLLTLAAGFWSRRSLTREQQLRYCALELSVITGKILSLLPLEVRNESPLFLESMASRVSQRKGSFLVQNANVIIVSIDALRPDHLGAYGYTRATSPNIDALAAKSVRFDNAYAQVPLTCYSVPSLHTGDYLRSTLPLLPKPPPTLARMLANRGYTTAAFYNASMFFCDDRRAMSYGESHFGFDYAETALRSAEDLTDRVLDYLESYRQQGKEKLFLWVHYFDVHEPYEERPDHYFGSSSLDRYDSEIAYVDGAVGRLVAAMSQLSGPTVFILTADHGEEFKEHGGYYHGSSLYQEQVRVPLIIGAPGLPPRVVKSPAELVDVVPTVLSLVGQRIPESVHGHSLVPMLQGREDPSRAAFAEVHTKKMVRYGSWKLIHDYRSGTFELYNLDSDPLERSNSVSRRPAEADRLKRLLNGWFDQIRAVATSVDRDRPEAIDLGRIGDRRSVPLLTQLLLSPRSPSQWRQEAARLIGQLQDAGVAEELWMGAGDDDERVAAEAAIALGEIKDKRARMVLPLVMATTDLELRTRAGIALGRVGSPEATPALIQALYSDNWEIQNRAAHYLGFVGDRRAVVPLLNAGLRPHLRGRVALALGRIGNRLRDKRALPALLEYLRQDCHAEVRQRSLAGLGFLGDRRAVRPLATLLAREPELMGVAETLSRLGAIGSWWIPGLDFTPARTGLKEGWGECVNNSGVSSDDYRESTWCESIAPVASVQFGLSRRPFAGELVLRLRALDPRLRGAPLLVAVNGRTLPGATLTGSWQVVRQLVDSRTFKPHRNQLRLQLVLPPVLAAAPPRAFLAVDYLLLIPRENGRR